MKWIALALVLVGFCHCASAPPPPPPVPVGAANASDGLEIETRIPVRVLRGESQIKVEIVPLKVAGNEAPAALLRISGVDHALAGVTFRATRVISGGNAEMWSIKFDGAGFHILRDRIKKPGITLLQLPSTVRSMELTEDALLAASVDVEAMREDHRRRLQDGSLAELERFHREPKIQGKIIDIEDARAKTEEACGVSIATSMQWDAVPDDALYRHLPCLAVLDAIKNACERNLATRRAVAAQIKEVQCHYSQKDMLKLGADGVLHSHETRETTQDTAFSKASEGLYARLANLLHFPPTVIKEAGGLVAIFDPDASRREIHMGRDGLFYRQLVTSGRLPRYGIWHAGTSASLELRADRSWLSSCGSTKKEFFELEDGEREDLLAKAKFEERYWKREAFALARDDRGIYYFVDRFNETGGGKGYRVFKGLRGAVKLTRLVDIVDDSDGMIFATTQGKLRLILNKKDISEAHWIEGKKKRPLVHLSIEENIDFIYGSMGVYQGAKFGTLCDL